jgi:hypothetical protein
MSASASSAAAAPPPAPLHAACASEPASAAALADARTADVIFIDNYDSFSYNIVQYLQELGAKVAVFRHDAIDVPTLGESLSWRAAAGAWQLADWVGRRSTPRVIITPPSCAAPSPLFIFQRRCRRVGW